MRSFTSLLDDKERPNGVILNEAKNLLFFFSSQKSKEEILRTYVLRMTDKGKLAKILEQPKAYKNF
jgi:DNA-binding transcriptional regulator PaaX